MFRSSTVQQVGALAASAAGVIDNCQCFLFLFFFVWLLLLSCFFDC